MATNDKHIREVMTPDPVCVSERDNIREVARIMAREDTGVAHQVREPTDLAALFGDVTETLRPLAEAKGVELTFGGKGPVTVDVLAGVHRLTAGDGVVLFSAP